MQKFILLFTILIVNGIVYSDPNSCRIFDLDKFVDSTELDIGQIAEFCSDRTKIRIYKGTNLIFPTTEGFTTGTLPSKFTIELDYIIKIQPTCTWTLISITDDYRQNELFSVSLDPDKKLVTVSFTDRYGKCFSSIFIDSDVCSNSRRKLVIEVDSREISVLADNKPLRYYSGNFNGDFYTREQIDLSNTETKLFRQGGDRYSVEMDIQSFVILSYIDFPRFIYGPKGEPGRDGRCGYEGLKGDKGIKGPSGYNGKNGEKGDCCETIYSPIEGPKGEDGELGEKGCDGPTGPKGLPGNDGAPGTNGDNGIDGSDGIPGEKGDDGDTGDTGISGAMGPNGIPGATGGQMTKDDINAILLEIFASKTLNTLRISSPRVSRTNPRVSRTK